MNVLCLAPVMSKALCDDYFMYKRLHDKGVNIAFIVGRSSGARGNITLAPYENLDGFPIYRLYRDAKEMLIFPHRRLKEVVTIAQELKTELILCHLADNMRLALLLQRYLKIPIVLHVEIAGARAQGTLPKKFVDGWKMRLIRFLIGMPITTAAFWSWLCRKADVLVTSNPSDQAILDQLSQYGKPIYYLPWPAIAYERDNLSSTRDAYRGIYAGNLNPYKNTEVFEWVLPLILESTPTREFIIIGTGIHFQIIKELQERFKGAVKHIPLLPRSEVARLISSSYYAFTPVKEGGLGFIGDCWGTGTPLLMLYNVFGSKDLEPCLASGREDLVRIVNRLYEDPGFYKQVQEIGYKEFKKRTADAVGDEFYNLLSTIEKPRV